MNLRESIRKNLILEKKIAQISSNIKIQFNFEVDRTSHAFDRSKRPDIIDVNYNQREISNSELKEFISLFIPEISEKIVTNEIQNKVSFVCKSLKWELAVPIIPIHEIGTYWVLKITTVFRESMDNPFRTGREQLVLWK